MRTGSPRSGTRASGPQVTCASLRFNRRWSLVFTAGMISCLPIQPALHESTHGDRGDLLRQLPLIDTGAIAMPHMHVGDHSGYRAGVQQGVFAVEQAAFGAL